MSPAPMRHGPPARLVELVGPAGAGKSTLARALPAQDPDSCGRFSLWGLPAGLLFTSTLRLIPTVLAAAFGGRPLRPAEVAQMARVEALGRAVDRAVRRGRRWIVFDEGPVFALTWFAVFYGRNGDPGWSAWRRRALDAWAGRLDAVVRLDAEDPVLARRIRGRSQSHMVKDRPDPEIFAFTARFRRAYDEVLADLARGGRPIILDVRTDASGGTDVQAVRLRRRIEEAVGGH